MAEGDSEDEENQIQDYSWRKGKQGKYLVESFQYIKANQSKITVLRLSHISGMLLET